MGPIHTTDKYNQGMNNIFLSLNALIEERKVHSKKNQDLKMSKEQTQDLKSRLERILAENIQAAKNCAAASDLQEHAVQEGFAQMDNARTEFRRTRTTKNEVKYKTFIRVAQSTGRLVVQFGGTVISLIGRAWKHI